MTAATPKPTVPAMAHIMALPLASSGPRIASKSTKKAIVIAIPRSGLPILPVKNAFMF